MIIFRCNGGCESTSFLFNMCKKQNFGTTARWKMPRKKGTQKENSASLFQVSSKCRKLTHMLPMK